MNDVDISYLIMLIVCMLILVSLIVFIIYVSVSDDKAMKQHKAEVDELKKNPLYHGTFWIP